MNCRVFIDRSGVSGGAGTSVRLTGSEAKYLTRVLRLKKGDFITLCTVDGLEHCCTVTRIEGKDVILIVDKIERFDRESNLDITLCQALPKGKKMDIIVRKGTELGVRRFIPFVSSRSVSRPKEKEAKEKVRRWGKIALEASRQCGRNFIPDVEMIARFDDVLNELSNTTARNTLKIIPWEGEERRGLREVASSAGWKGSAPEKVIIIIGPEGGFSGDEAELAIQAGVLPVSLGKRLLKTETAGPAVISIIQYIWGDMG